MDDWKLPRTDHIVAITRKFAIKEESVNEVNVFLREDYRFLFVRGFTVNPQRLPREPIDAS